MRSIPLTATSPDSVRPPVRTAVASHDTVPLSFGRLELDTDANELRYELASEITPMAPVVRICGFAPSGWEASTLVELTGPRGVWHYADSDEDNILAGLASIDMQSDGGSPVFRGQIEMAHKPAARFPRAPERSRILGTCDRSLTMFGLFDRVKVEMAPAIVSIVRTPADPSGEGAPQVALAFEAQCDGGTVLGIGHVNIDVRPLGGLVRSLQGETDFPATMSMSLRMRYLTPFGNFITEVETYLAERIDEFPPFGVELQPAEDVVRVLDERDGRHVGDEYLGPLVALFHLAAEQVPDRIPVRKVAR